MHRMRRFFVTPGLALIVTAFATSQQAEAALIRPNAGRAYPDIAADINGRQTYDYNETTQSGRFEVTNTPYLIAGGPSADQEYAILPGTDGVRSQTVVARIDSTGKLVEDAGNLYELKGTITADGQTFSGILLSGVPTAFGSQDLGVAGIEGSDAYDFDLKITGGALAPYFGADAYMRITPELQSTFDGTFTKSFTGVKATSNTRGYNSPQPFPIPEPSTLVLMAACGGIGLVFRHRRRVSMGD